MSDTLAIQAHNLGKSFRIGEGRSKEAFWALRAVSFEVAAGEVLGIVGANGAGKSTLLRILSRITAPTEGFAQLRGRVGCLLEVGTGFHHELTGRENVYLNAAIHGLTTDQVDTRFDDIVAFSGVERFLDTPVKRYSSGMQVRLAFAVAAHLEPEVLIIDEVLAVGDTAFQRRCLGKMSEVAGAGRTVLFVSHNLATVQHLCSRTLWLDGGRVRTLGATADVVAQYLASTSSTDGAELASREDRRGDGSLRFSEIRCIGHQGPALRSGDPAQFVLRYETRTGEPIELVHLALMILDPTGTPMLTLASKFSGETLSLQPRGELLCDIPRLPLAHGSYQLNLWSEVNGREADSIDIAMEITVAEGDYFGSGRVVTPSKHGHLLTDHHWHTPTDRAASE